ncbi:MAG: TetR family transcriptional regulator [Proteobacteria bacterium]|nr:TetR family transcriptional regulator [Pseudomonadota bacterium]
MQRRAPRARAAAPARDAEASRARILEAATAEFAAHGLAGARVDRIAVAARANKRMLYYYFGNKDALFAAVMAQAYSDIRAAEQALELHRHEPVEGVRRLVAFTWKYFVTHPEFVTLLNSENLHRARHVKGIANIAAIQSPLIATLADVLARGEREHLFRAGVDPVQLYISIAGICYFYFSNRHTLSTIFARDLMSPRAQAARIAHMTDVILGYLLLPHAPLHRSP